MLKSQPQQLKCTHSIPRHLFSSQILDDDDHLIGDLVAEAAKTLQQRGNGSDQALPFGQQQ